MLDLLYHTKTTSSSQPGVVLFRQEKLACLVELIKMLPALKMYTEKCRNVSVLQALNSSAVQSCGEVKYTSLEIFSYKFSYSYRCVEMCAARSEKAPSRNIRTLKYSTNP